MPVRPLPRPVRRWAPVVAVALLALALGAFPSAAPAGSSVGPAKLKEVATGVVSLRMVACNGKTVGRGTGFLVGRSVVMTNRHLLAGACSVRVALGGKTLSGSRFVSWSGEGTPVAAVDLATIKLDAPANGAHVFTFRGASPPNGTTLATAGFATPARLTSTQGKVVWRGLAKAVPLIAVRIPHARGADGAPLIDAAGRVVGILRNARGSHGTSRKRPGEVEGLDLARWWGVNAAGDLCASYPSGGIAECPVAEPEPEPTPVDPPIPDQPDPTPPDPTTPPVSPTSYELKACWTQFSGSSWDSVAEAKATTSFAASDLLARGPINFWSIALLKEGAPAVINGVTASLISPGGFVSPGLPFDWIADGDRASQTFAWTLSGLDTWFFESPNYPPPATWRIRWAFPNGQTCDTPFTVT